MPKFYAVSIETPLYSDNRFNAYLQYSDASHKMLQWLTEYDFQSVYDTLTLRHDASYDNTVKIGSTTFRFTCVSFYDDDDMQLSSNVVDSLVETTNALCEKVIENKEDHLDSIDETNHYKEVLLDDIATWLDHQVNDQINEVLKHYGVSLSVDNTEYLLQYHADKIFTCHYVSGYYKSGNKHYVHSYHVSEIETPMPVSVCKALSEKLDYYVDGDSLTMGVNGFYELRLVAYEVLKILAHDMQ